jgi:4-hydroxy-3-polyprenylbenzoate decarboxylase
VASRSALLTLEHELPGRPGCFRELADVWYDNTEIGAAIASGTFKTAGMAVVPCSMKTLAGICAGYADTLILRAADVTLKERRPLVLAPRETPLSGIHLRNMAELAHLGAIMLPPMLSFYHRPESVADMVRHVTGKIMDVFGDEAPQYRRWSGGAA